MPRDCPPTRTDMTVLELMFESQAMLLVGRLLIVVTAIVLLVCAVFILVSMVVRMRQGHWLKRAGPFEVSESVTGMVDQRTQALTEILATHQSQLVELEVLVEAAKRAVGGSGDRR